MSGASGCGLSFQLLTAVLGLLPPKLTPSFFPPLAPFFHPIPSSFSNRCIFTYYVNTCRLRKAPLHPPPLPTSYNNLPTFLSPPFLSPACLLSSRMKKESGKKGAKRRGK